MARGRQIFAREQGLADGREMAEAGNDAIKGKWGDCCLRVLDQHEASLGCADLGNCGRHRRRKVCPIGNGGPDFR